MDNKLYLVLWKDLDDDKFEAIFSERHFAVHLMHQLLDAGYAAGMEEVDRDEWFANNKED